jgi:hypothetical protein
LRARVGFSPKSPQQDAGMRIDPPPSLAWAAGTIPAATAAAAPPEDPPAECVVRQGLRVGPNSTDSVDVVMPNSGDADLPKSTSPAFRYRATSSLSRSGMKSSKSRDPLVMRTPAQAACRSLIRNGTPRRGPSGSPFSTPRRASSNMQITTALNCGLRASTRAMASSSSSRGVTSPLRTRSASARASQAS